MDRNNRTAPADNSGRRETQAGVRARSPIRKYADYNTPNRLESLKRSPGNDARANLPSQRGSTKNEGSAVPQGLSKQSTKRRWDTTVSIDNALEHIREGLSLLSRAEGMYKKVRGEIVDSKTEEVLSAALENERQDREKIERHIKVKTIGPDKKELVITLS